MIAVARYINGEGYRDPTAGRAMARIDACAEARDRLRLFRDGVRLLARACGMRASVRLRDRSTGEELDET